MNWDMAEASLALNRRHLKMLAGSRGARLNLQPFLATPVNLPPFCFIAVTIRSRNMDVQPATTGRKKPGAKTNERYRHRSRRLRAAESLDLEQGERRPLRQHQPPDRRPDARQGAAGRPPSAAALFAGHAERREGHGDARGAAGARPQRRRIRRLADQDRRRPVRQRLRRGQPELQDPGADGPQRADADPGVRVRRDPAVPRREVRRVPAGRRPGARRMPVVAVLADGQRAVISAAASATSTPMRRPRSNTPSTASRWR